MAKPPGNKGMQNKRGLLGLNSLNAIPAEDIEALRRGVFNVVRSNIPRVRQVLEGTRKWDPQQTRLYLALMNKVLPELTASYSENHHTHSIEELGQQELLEIIAAETARAKIIDVTPLDKTPTGGIDPEPVLRDSPIFPKQP